ncbi:hypothetical protein [Paenibacillus sp. J5C2022]|uniref:hypothetical protein n=1 Tax=Paenibacillus sp. J5C2022 TaxID=2977129 RepID=UPI0021D23E8C|nr:hypothetical protein [Paenibacillus sp. J5C2022]
MAVFQDKVQLLRDIESITYTYCLRLLAEEPTAAAAAQKVLCHLFQDCEFWRMNDGERQRYILKKCFQLISQQMCKEPQLA